MNMGKLLVEIGYKHRSAPPGLPCPALVRSDGAIGQSWGYVETREQVAMEVDHQKTPTERFSTKESRENVTKFK